MSIYQEVILDHYRNPRNAKLLSDPTGSIHLTNPFCGDTITLQIKEEGTIITDVGYSASGCAISIATASMLSELIIGKTKEEVLKLDKDDIMEMLHITLSPNRLKCALLSLEAVHKVITNKKNMIH
jgi:nitrogen fixation NifU-like protein